VTVCEESMYSLSPFVGYVSNQAFKMDFAFQSEVTFRHGVH
jgi:hypothetical protein